VLTDGQLTALSLLHTTGSPVRPACSGTGRAQGSLTWKLEVLVSWRVMVHVRRLAARGWESNGLRLRQVALVYLQT
jgi:hypothetical protein